MVPADLNASPMPVCPNCRHAFSVMKVADIHLDQLKNSDLVTLLQFPKNKVEAMVALSDNSAEFHRDVSNSPFAGLWGHLGFPAAIGCISFGASLLTAFLQGKNLDDLVRVWLVASLAVMVLFLFLVLRKVQVQHSEGRIMRALWLEMHPEAVRRWKSAFYCSNCEGVFWPDINRYVPVERFKHALYND
jgi:hypothetical protein